TCWRSRHNGDDVGGETAVSGNVDRDERRLITEKLATRKGARSEIRHSVSFHRRSSESSTARSVRIWGNTLGPPATDPFCDRGYSRYSGTPLRSNDASMREISGARFVQSALSVTTPLRAKPSVTDGARRTT